MGEIQKKTILVTIFHGLVSKNILNTEALTMLRDSNTYKIVLLVPGLKKKFFEQYYSHPNISIEGVDMTSFVNSRWEVFMHTLSRLLIDTHYLHYKRRELLDAKPTVWGWIQYFIREIVVYVCADKSFFKRVFRFLDTFNVRDDVFSRYFDKYSPDLVFCTDLFEQMGAQLLREAGKRNIRTLGMVRSWDNCLSKGLLRVCPQNALVNNEVIKEELHRMHGVNINSIETVGLPQFDSFITSPRLDKNELFAKYGLDPNKKLVMFAPAGKILSDTDPDICKILIDARNKNKIPQDVQFFIRNHFQHPALLDEFENIPGVHVQSPGVMLDKTTHKETELTPEDQIYLRNILAHTDVLIWVATSLCLDALVFNKPEVVVNFDGYTPRPYYQSVKRYHDEDHMKKMFALKPFRIANNETELIDSINTYLKTPSLDEEARTETIKQQLYRLDGKAGERIALAIERCFL